MDSNLRLGYAAVRLGPETGTRHRPHAEVKMAAEPKAWGSLIFMLVRPSHDLLSTLKGRTLVMIDWEQRLQPENESTAGVRSYD